MCNLILSAGRFSAMLMIVVAIILVPQMTNELLEKISRQVGLSLRALMR